MFALSLVVPAAQASSAIQTTFNLTTGQTNESWSNSGTNSGVLTLSFGNAGTITFTGYSCPQTLCNSTPTNQGTQVSLTDSNGALGLYTNPGESQIPRNDFVTVDFSNFKGVITNVTFGMVDVVDGWDIYQTAIKNELASAGGTPPTALAQANNGGVTGLPTTSNSTIGAGANFGSTSLNGNPGKFLTVTALQSDCEVEIGTFGITYTPEPATLVLMGGALLGLGVAGKKLRRRS